MPSIRVLCSELVYQNSHRKLLGDELREIVARFQTGGDLSQVECLWFPFSDSQGADQLSLDIVFSQQGSICGPEPHGPMTEALREYLLATGHLPWDIEVGVAPVVSFQGTYYGGKRIVGNPERRDPDRPKVDSVTQRYSPERRN